MDSVFRSAKEKLEREHKERKESGKVKLEKEKKAKDAAERQREAIEASQRDRRLKAQMKVEEDNLCEGKEEALKIVLPQWIIKQGQEKVDVASDKASKVHEYEYGKAYYAALLSQQGVAEEEDDDDVEWDDEGETPLADKEEFSLIMPEDSSMQVLPQWMIMQGRMNLIEEQRGGMRQEANVDGGSDKLLYEYRKAYYAALLNQQRVADEEGDDEDVEWEEEEESLVNCRVHQQ